MAVPSNYIDKITKGNDSRDICPAADKVRVNNENFEGSDLDEVLDEVAQSIPTKTSDLNNDSGFVTETEMESAIDEAVDGYVESVTINGTKHTPDSQGDVDLGTIQGEKGDKGDKGDTVLISETPQEFAGMIVNDLTTGGGGSALSAEMGVLLKQNVNSIYSSLSRLYSKLANLAFLSSDDKTAAAPTALNWNVPNKTLTISNGISNSVVTYNGETVGSSMQVEVGTTIQLIVSGADGYAITSCSASVGTAINNSDGTFTVSVTVNDNMTLTLSGTATAKPVITITNSIGNGAVITDGSDNVLGGSVTVLPGASFTIKVAAASGYELSDFDLKVGGSSVSPTESSGVYSYTISAVNADTTIVVSGEVWVIAPKSAYEYGYSINGSGTNAGKPASDSDSVICYPKVVSGAVVGNSETDFINVENYKGGVISIKTRPAASGYLYIAAPVFYKGSVSSPTFISPRQYYPCYADNNWEADQEIPLDAKYVKILICWKVYPSFDFNDNEVFPSGAANVNFDATSFAALADDFLKYKLTTSNPE